MVDFLFASIDFFRHLLRFQSYEAKCLQLGCFRRGSHSNFTSTKSSPAILGVKKLETAGLPDVEDRILLRFLILTQYRSVTDRRTDGRICRSIYSATRCKTFHYTAVTRYEDNASCEKIVASLHRGMNTGLEVLIINTFQLLFVTVRRSYVFGLSFRACVHPESL